MLRKDDASGDHLYQTTSTIPAAPPPPPPPSYAQRPRPNASSRSSLAASGPGKLAPASTASGHGSSKFFADRVHLRMFRALSACRSMVHMRRNGGAGRNARQRGEDRTEVAERVEDRDDVDPVPIRGSPHRATAPSISAQKLRAPVGDEPLHPPVGLKPRPRPWPKRASPWRSSPPSTAVSRRSTRSAHRVCSAHSPNPASTMGTGCRRVKLRGCGPA